jgi:hypothetical protein
MSATQYEWAIYKMRGNEPSDDDLKKEWGTAHTQEDAEQEARQYLMMMHSMHRSDCYAEVAEVARRIVFRLRTQTVKK